MLTLETALDSSLRLADVARALFQVHYILSAEQLSQADLSTSCVPAGVFWGADMHIKVRTAWRSLRRSRRRQAAQS